MNHTHDTAPTQAPRPTNALPFRVIALDLDGTLTNSSKEVTPRTRQALLKAQTDGAALVLASGRPTYGIAPIAQCLEMEQRGGYILSYNGGQIIDWRTKEVLYERHLPSEAIPVICQYAQSKGYALLGYAGNEIVTESLDDEYVHEESRINKMNIRHVSDLQSVLPPHPTKLLMTGHPSQMEMAEQELSQLLGPCMEVFRSTPFFLELVPKGIDKAQSLLRLLGHINLSPADMVAFGDGYNDLSMLHLAGVGVAMANAAPEVRAEADMVTLSNDADGIAVALQKLSTEIL